jgi:hypothetical protein
MSNLQDTEKPSLRSVLAVIALAIMAQEWFAECSKMILLLHLHLLKGAAKVVLYCATFSPARPRRAETRRLPKRAHSYRARSASKKGTWPLPPLLADFFSILLHHNAAASMNVLPRQPPGLLSDDERYHIGDVFRRTKPLQG